MEALTEFTIPVHGIQDGVHHFDYVIDWRFFKHFEGSPVDQGRFDVRALFTKDNDHWILSAEINGTLDTACDRCLAPISLPVSGSHVIIVKFDEEVEEDPDPDVIYLSRDISHWNIAQYLHEFIVLSIPVTKTYDCESEAELPCDKEVLAKLEQEEQTEGEGNPAWDILKETDWQK